MEKLEQSEVSAIRSISNVLGSDFTELEQTYQSIKIQGFANQTDILQLTDLGIPIYDALVYVAPVLPEEIQDYVSQSKITYAQIKQCFENLTSEGGIFYKEVTD